MALVRYAPFTTFDNPFCGVSEYMLVALSVWVVVVLRVPLSLPSVVSVESSCVEEFVDSSDFEDPVAVFVPVTLSVVLSVVSDSVSTVCDVVDDVPPDSFDASVDDSVRCSVLSVVFSAVSSLVDLSVDSPVVFSDSPRDVDPWLDVLAVSVDIPDSALLCLFVPDVVFSDVSV